MPDKTMLKLGPLAAIFVGKPAIMAAKAVSRAIPATMVVGVVVIAAASFLSSSGGQDSKLPQKY